VTLHAAEALETPAPLVRVWVQTLPGRAGRGEATAEAMAEEAAEEAAETIAEEIAEETPVALALNGISQAVMMATPADLEDFAFGFALTEGWIAQRHQLLEVDIQTHGDGVVVELTTTAACDHHHRVRRRSLAGRTGCGLCGVESLEQLRQPLRTSAGPTRATPIDLRADALARAAASLHRHQPLQARCGGVHAAAWCNLEGEVLRVREDVGRHNALDKLIGALLRSDAVLSDGFVFMSSRCSYELVQKLGAAGIGALACVSAPTAHAVRTAADCGVSLWGFVREGRASRYA